MTMTDQFKIVAKAIDKRCTIPVLSLVMVCDGVARATDCDIEIIAPTDKLDGFYNAKGETPASVPPSDQYCPLAFEATQTIYIGGIQEILARIITAVSKEQTRYYLNGAYFEFNDGLKVTSTDGHRMLHYSVPGFEPSNVPSFIMPRKTVEILAKIKGGAWTLQYDDMRNRIRLSDGLSGLSITSKVIDGTFPDYSRVFPKGPFNMKLVGTAAECAEAAKRVATYGSERSKSVTIDSATLSMRPDDVAPLSIEWPVVVHAANPIVFGLNPKYLLDMVTLAKSNKTARFEFAITDPSSPIRVSFPDDPGLIGVLMPLRV